MTVRELRTILFQMDNQDYEITIEELVVLFNMSIFNKEE
jgi:hypothetical protein